MAETNKATEALAFLEFVESLPDGDAMRKFLYDWRRYRSFHGEKGDGGDPFEFPLEDR